MHSRRVVSAARHTGATAPARSYAVQTFSKIMSSNRGEIAIRLFRAGTELGYKTLGVFSKEDSHSLHRYKCDQSYLYEHGRSNEETRLGR